MIIMIMQLLSTPIVGQELAKAPADARDRKNFLEFEIPALINGSKIDPSPITNLAMDLGDKRVSLKTGFQLDRKGTDAYRWTFTAAPYAQASDGISSVFSKGEGISDFGFALGLNWVFKRTNFLATEVGAEELNKRLGLVQERLDARTPMGENAAPRKIVKKDDLVSLRVHWLAVRYSMDRCISTVFDSSAAFAYMQQDRELALGQAYLSYNYFFQSTLPKYRLWNMIASVGIGYASFSNYKQLAERELLQGAVVYNTDSSSVRIISEKTDGRSGRLKVTTGLTAYAEFYKTVVQLSHSGAIRLGARYTHFGLGTDEENSILSGGFFITTKKKPNEDGKSEDAANFSISIQLDQFQKNGDADYFDRNAKIMLGAAIPLRFR